MIFTFNCWRDDPQTIGKNNAGLEIVHQNWNVRANYIWDTLGLPRPIYTFSVGSVQPKKREFPHSILGYNVMTNQNLVYSSSVPHTEQSR